MIVGDYGEVDSPVNISNAELARQLIKFKNDPPALLSHNIIHILHAILDHISFVLRPVLRCL